MNFKASLLREHLHEIVARELMEVRAEFERERAEDAERKEGP
jgi:hypothetical protein